MSKFIKKNRFLEKNYATWGIKKVKDITLYVIFNIFVVLVANYVY
jgi:hypothetical protein